MEPWGTDAHCSVSQLLPEDKLSWVCKYPGDVPASAWGASGALSFSAWTQAGADYFSALSAAGASSSCAMLGPCYPVLTSQANVWQTCQTQKLSNLPLNTAAVNGLTTCIACCNSATAYADASCQQYDSSNPKINTVFQWPQHANSTGPYASANDRIDCLQSCQGLHGSIQSFVDDTEGSVHPLALALFNATCAARNASSAAVPAPATSDGGAMAAVLGAIASSYKATALRYVADMMLAWRALVVCGLFLPFIMSFAWLGAMRMFVAPLVYLTVLCVDIATLGVTLYCFSKAGAIGKNSFNGIVSYSDAGGFSFNATAASQASAQLSTTPTGAISCSYACLLYVVAYALVRRRHHRRHLRPGRHLQEADVLPGHRVRHPDRAHLAVHPLPAAAPEAGHRHHQGCLRLTKEGAVAHLLPLRRRPGHLGLHGLVGGCGHLRVLVGRAQEARLLRLGAGRLR